MIACLDVHYAEGRATAACIRFRHWADEKSVDVVTASMDTVAAYESGEFYKRELAPLLRVLERSGQSAQTLVIDGYVWLDAQGSPGLEALLYAATGGQSRVIGIRQEPTQKRGFAYHVMRGSSTKPLYVTAIGLDTADAAEGVKNMHGPHRIPTMVRAADRVSRNGQ